MAEENDSSATEPESPATTLTRRVRVRREPVRRATAVRAARPAATPRPSAAKPARRPLRTLATITIVAGLIATVALPAYGAFRTSVDAPTLQQLAEDGAQTFVVASDATAPVLKRDTYAATTPAEIAKKKAAAAAAARARAEASFAAVQIDLSMVAPGTGAVRWPLASKFTLGDGFRSRGGEHMGIDMLTAGGTPIFAAAAGVVRVSSESFGGYGVAITIDHVIDGHKVSTLYGHMRYGSRQVHSGQRVAVGQVIGLVGSTGRSTANHLHFEVFVNGSNVDPLAWLKANAG